MAVLDARIISFERRAPQADGSPSLGVDTPASATPAPPATSMPVVSNPPLATKPLIAVMTVIGLLVLASVAWCLIRSRKRKQPPPSPLSHPEKRGSAGQETIFGSDSDAEACYGREPVLLGPQCPSPESAARWMPQVPVSAAQRPIDGPFSKLAELQIANPDKRHLDSPLNSANLPTPPPAYKGHSARPPSIHVVEPSTPSVHVVEPSTPVVISPAPSTPKSALQSSCWDPESPSDGPRLGLPGGPNSPRRSASFVHEQSKSRSERSRSILTTASGFISGKRLPRKMTVAHSFVVTLADELIIAPGETLMMLEEYADAWCLCQRVDGAEEPKQRGVVPHFCLQERSKASKARSTSVSKSLKA